MLPIMLDIADVDTWTKYLGSKINGAMLKEAESVLPKSALDGRKLSGLQTWGVINRVGDRVTLTELGRDYVRATDDEKKTILRGIISSVSAYTSILEWASYQSLTNLTPAEVGSRWMQYNRDDVQTDSENTLNNNAVCFFRLAEGAGLGDMKVGRRGQPTRLELNHSSINSFVRPSLGQQPSPTPSAFDCGPEEDSPPPNLVPTPPTASEPSTNKPAQVSRVFVAHSDNNKILEQIKTILHFGNFEIVVAEEEESTAVPVPAKVINAMHRCQAAIINISADRPIDDGTDQFTINENVLIEVGAAFVLYQQEVILLVDERIRLPSNLQGLYECRYHGDSLDFDSSMKLQQALTNFRERSPSDIP